MVRNRPNSTVSLVSMYINSSVFVQKRKWLYIRAIEIVLPIHLMWCSSHIIVIYWADFGLVSVGCYISTTHFQSIVYGPFSSWCIPETQIACCQFCPTIWWRHQMETFSALLAIRAGNSPVPGEFPAQRPVTRSFDVFFDLRLNERLRKQS